MYAIAFALAHYFAHEENSKMLTKKNLIATKTNRCNVVCICKKKVRSSLHDKVQWPTRFKCLIEKISNHYIN